MRWDLHQRHILGRSERFMVVDLRKIRSFVREILFWYEFAILNFDFEALSEDYLQQRILVCRWVIFLWLVHGYILFG